MTAPTAAIRADLLADYLRDGRRHASVAVRRARLRLRPDSGPRDAGAAAAALSPDAAILVLCYGNVCRSPFAARYLRTRLAARGIDGVRVASAGFHRTEGRPSPPGAIRAASHHGVDLDDHRSRRVTTAMLDASDAVFVMDARNLVRLDREFGVRPDRDFLLAELADGEGGGFEIPDPWDGDLDTFVAAYAQVAAGVDGVVERLAGDE